MGSDPHAVELCVYDTQQDNAVQPPGHNHPLRQLKPAWLQTRII